MLLSRCWATGWGAGAEVGLTRGGAGFANNRAGSRAAEGQLRRAQAITGDISEHGATATKLGGNSSVWSRRTRLKRVPSTCHFAKQMKCPFVSWETSFSVQNPPGPAGSGGLCQPHTEPAVGSTGASRSFLHCKAGKRSEGQTRPRRHGLRPAASRCPQPALARYTRRGRGMNGSPGRLQVPRPAVHCQETPRAGPSPPTRGWLWRPGSRGRWRTGVSESGQPASGSQSRPRREAHAARGQRRSQRLGRALPVAWLHFSAFSSSPVQQRAQALCPEACPTALTLNPTALIIWAPGAWDQG